ncbi:MAG: hypothetical protein KDC54_03760, partial [Lewinella sp.]|nr:hypothetical protein [Lewinella sp.]
MDRKKFLRKSLLGMSAIVALPTVITSCTEEDDLSPDACGLSPSETAGPFPIKTPADLARENIISDRVGVPLLITLKIQGTDCSPLTGVFVDLWH